MITPSVPQRADRNDFHTVLEMEHGVRFETIAVVVVGNPAAHSLRIYLQIAYAKALEQETEGLDILCFWGNLFYVFGIKRVC